MPPLGLVPKFIWLSIRKKERLREILKEANIEHKEYCFEDKVNFKIKYKGFSVTTGFRQQTTKDRIGFEVVFCTITQGQKILFDFYLDSEKNDHIALSGLVSDYLHKKENNLESEIKKNIESFFSKTGLI
jgi:hypothetical protein